MISFKIWNKIYNPFFPWWKARKYFKRPKWRIFKGKDLWFYGLPINRKVYKPIIDIRSNSLGWKSKYDSPRHEWDPYIAITFFRRYTIAFQFTYDTGVENDSIRNMATWEAMLDYLYFGKSIEECILSHVWSGDITIHKNLKKCST